MRGLAPLGEQCGQLGDSARYAHRLISRQHLGHVRVGA